MRLVIRGCTGSGKSTLGAQLAKELDVPIFDLDDLRRLSSWKRLSPDELRRKVAAAIAGEEWIVVGNYACCDDIVSQRATAFVWLNYSMAITLARLMGRTVRRAMLGDSHRTRLVALASTLWHLRSFPHRYRTAGEFVSKMEPGAAPLHHFRHPREAERWCQTLCGTRRREPELSAVAAVP